MALVSESDKANLVAEHEWRARRKGEQRESEYEDDRGRELTSEEQDELDTVRYCLRLLEDGVRARQPFDTFDEAWDTFNGDLWPIRFPYWKARITINKIRAYVYFEQAVMTDNKPRISVEPLVAGTEDAADILSKIVDRDWDQLGLQKIISLAALYGIIWGTGIGKAWYDPHARNGKGAKRAQAVVPYRIWTNRTASGVEDAQYIIHVEEQTIGWIWENFPERAERVEKYVGARLATDTHNDRDFIREGRERQVPRVENAMSAAIQSGSPSDGNGGPVTGYNTVPGGLLPLRTMAPDDTIEVQETWYRDPTREWYREQEMVDGQPQWEDALDDDGLPELQLTGYEPDLLDGEIAIKAVYVKKRAPKMKWKTRLVYPNGRLSIIAGPVLVCDIPNPFQTTGFPFASFKLYDVGTFWGQGEVLSMKDPQVAMNRMKSQLYDILEKTGNPQYKYEKGNGLDLRSLKNKPGSIIPLDKMGALEALNTKEPSGQFHEVADSLGRDLGSIAGLQDSVMGAAMGGNQSFATIDQLQESGAAPLRHKVRNLEEFIKRMGTLLLELTQQFDEGDQPLRIRNEKPAQPIVDPDTGEVVEIIPAAQDVKVTFTRYKKSDIIGAVEFSVVPDSSLSTSPAGLWNKYMTLWDKKLIDEQGWHEKFRIDGWRGILQRLQDAKRQAAMASMQKAAMKKGGGGKGKPGPEASRPPRSGARPAPPASNQPTRLELNSVR